jgi:hypothetical protein
MTATVSALSGRLLRRVAISAVALLVVGGLVAGFWGNECDGGDYCAHQSGWPSVAAWMLTVLIDASALVLICCALAAITLVISRRRGRL